MISIMNSLPISLLQTLRNVDDQGDLNRVVIVPDDQQNLCT